MFKAFFSFLKFLVYSVSLFILFIGAYFTYITYVNIKPPHHKQVPEKYTKLLKLINEKNVTLSNGISLNVIESGDSKNKMMLFIHGFPETALVSWSTQIEFFSQKGYFVVAPDLIGFGSSLNEEAEKDYMKSNHRVMADYIKLLLEHYKREKIILVGHDWGAGAAFMFASENSDKIEKFIILNMIHPQLFGEKPLSLFPSQIFMSWYIFYFQLNGISEARLEKDNFAFLKTALKHHSAQDIALLEAQWKKKGAITSMLNWYRYSIRYGLLHKTPVRTITAPFLLLFGKDDSAIDYNNAIATCGEPFASNCSIKLFDGVDHWIQHTNPDLVNEEIIKFIQ